MAQFDYTYHGFLDDINDHGFWYEDKRRKVERKQIPYAVLPHMLSSGGMPVLTTKEVSFKNIWGELLWFLKGRNDKKWLNDRGIHIWDKDIDNFNGKDAGKNYGILWRDYNGVDQLGNLLENFQINPMETRSLVSSWDPSTQGAVALPPCHYSWQILPRPLATAEREIFFSSKETYEEYSKMKFDNSDERHEYLNKFNLPTHSFTMLFNMRSADAFLGVPYNMASYATLAFLFGEMTGTIAERLVGSLANPHIYDNHLDAVKKQLRNDPSRYGAPAINFSDNAKELFAKYKKGEINHNDVFDALDIDDASLTDYDHYDKIKAEMLSPVV